MHRMVAVSTKDIELQEDGTYRTEDYIYFAKYLILQELYNTHQEHKNKFGNMVLALDNASGGYWRKDVYPRYKSKRKDAKEVSPINWDEVYPYINALLDSIKEHLPWKIVSVKRAEADDIMLTLARQYNSQEKILIHSPDKDMIQAQKDSNGNVFQYSALTKKWLVPENKHDDMEDWLLEHVCLGDASDEVPRIVDETIFSDNFLKYLKDNNINIDLRKDNSTGVTGVYYIEKYNEWLSKLQYKKKKYSQKHSTYEKAVRCRLLWEMEVLGYDLSPQKHLFEKYGVN
jgi:5'-3' exonuclease